MKIGERVDMTMGNPYRQLIIFSIPLLLGNLFQQLYNTADSAIVGQMLGTEALASVGVGFPFMAIIFCIFIGLGMAATVMVSQAAGAHDYARVNLIINTIYKFSLLAVIPVTLIGYFGAGPVLRLLNVPDDGTLSMANEYLQMVFLGIIATMGYNLNAGLLQGMGDSITSLLLLIMASIVNIALDYLFIGPLALGVAGAALATIIAQALSWVLGLIVINRRHEFLRINLLKLDFDRNIFKETVRLGIPSAIQNALFSLGSLAFMSIITGYGSSFIAGFNGANKIDMFVFMPVQSIANAATTYVGQNIGARNMERLNRGMRSALVLNVSVVLVTSFICYLSSTPLLRLFGDDPAMIESGNIYLHSVLPFYFLLAILFTYNGALRGAGQMSIPLLSSMISLWLARVPMGFYLSLKFGKEYIYYSYAIGWLLGCIISVCFFYFGKWRERLYAKIQAEKAYLEKEASEAAE